MKKLARRSDALDEICATVGFSATISLMRWFGGSNIYVPKKKGSDRMLSSIIGRMACNRMVDVFAGETLWIPEDLSGRYKAADERLRGIARMIRSGASRKHIADSMGISLRSVDRVRSALKTPVVRLVARSDRRAKSGENLE